MALRTLCYLVASAALLFSPLSSSASSATIQQEPEKPEEPKGPEKPKGPEEPKGPDEPEGSEEPKGPDDPRGESATGEVCCFTNPYFEGECRVSPGEDESCQSILLYLNSANTEGKTYCGTSLTRGGWHSVFCKEEEPD